MIDRTAGIRTMILVVLLFFSLPSAGGVVYRHITKNEERNTSRKVTKSEGGWSFSWPYGSDGRCVCHEGLGGVYGSEEECLEAFSHSPSEYCLYEGHVGLSKDDCEFATSKVNSVLNSECSKLCLEFIAKGSLYEEFDSKCSFERIYIHEGKVVPEGNCYDNTIYGHSDASVHLSVLKDQKRSIASGGIFSNVFTAAQCQELCQLEPSCANWFWRRLPDETGGDSLFPPFTCFLKSEDNVYGSAMISMSSALALFPSPTDPGWSYCDFRSVNLPPLHYESPHPFLECDCDPVCVWSSPHHVSGPRFCDTPVSCCSPPLQPPPPKVLVSTEMPPEITSSANSITVTARNPSTQSLSNDVLEGLSTTMVSISHEVTLDDGTKATKTTELPLISLLTSSVPINPSTREGEVCETICYPNSKPTIS